MKKIANLFVVIFLASPLLFVGQDDEEKKEFCVPITEKKAISLYEKGTNKKKYKEKKERMEFLNKALELEPDFIEAQFALAQEMLTLWKLEKMKSFNPIGNLYKNIVFKCPSFHSDPYYYIGYNYYEEGRNDSAKKYLQSYINFKDNDNSKYAKDYEQMAYNAKMMLTQLRLDMAKDKKNVLFDPKVVLPISTQFDEFLCYITADDSTFYFTRRQPFQSKNSIHEVDELQETFMVAKRQSDGTWNEGDAMPKPFNANEKEGGPTLTINNKRLYYTIIANDGGGMNTDIYYSDYNSFDEVWSKPSKVANINDPIYWDSQPSISADGNTLFFVSDREGGFGKTDIYMAFRNVSTGQFGKPINVGPGINTALVEKCPFIHSDSETLYYSSEGIPTGYGGLDIYYVRKDVNGRWKMPENIGSPINTAGDDAGFFASADGKWGYIAAEASAIFRGEGVGKYDIFRFELYEEARPQEVTILRGDLKNKEGGMIKGAQVEILNPISKESINAIVDSTDGKFMAAINKSKFKDKIIVSVKKEGTAFNATIIDVKDATFTKQPQAISLTIKEIALNENIILNEIHYKSNSAELEQASFIMLDEFAIWLKENIKIKVEIGGHTDNVGSSSAKLALSSDRAFTVKSYLEEKGIEGKRITAKGYGDKSPLIENNTEEGKAINRRTEFKILAK